jgi:hypothetical protein
MIIKPLSNDAVCNTTSFNSFSNSTLVRINYSAAATATAQIICKDSTNTSINWTISVYGGSSTIIEKRATDLITSNLATALVTGCPVSYKS